jgi:hypothetical protein
MPEQSHRENAHKEVLDHADGRARNDDYAFVRATPFAFVGELPESVAHIPVRVQRPTLRESDNVVSDAEKHDKYDRSIDSAFEGTRY